jgi:2-haloacid dehalogenase
MTDDVLLSLPRRKLLAGLGAAAIGGVMVSAVGRAAPARAQESKSGAVVPSILAFDVNESLLDIRHLVPLFERLFGDGKFVNEWYAQLILHSEAISLAGGPYTPFFNLSEAVFKSMGSIHGVSIQQADIAELEMRSATMPAHPDVPAGLKQLKDAGFRLVTLTNSPQGAQIIQLNHAGIDSFFEKFLSVDLVRRYVDPCVGYSRGTERWLSGSAYRPTLQCSAAHVGRAWVAGAGSRRAKSFERGRATDQALALIVFAPNLARGGRRLRTDGVRWHLARAASGSLPAVSCSFHRGMNDIAAAHLPPRRGMGEFARTSFNDH